MRAALVAALTLAACGNDGDNGMGPGQGQFEADVSGGVTASFTGTAFHGEATDPNTQDEGWVLVLSSGDPNNLNSVFVVRLAGRPGTGTYALIDVSTSGDLDDGDWAAIVTVSVGGQLTYFAASVSGSVTITSSSGERVRGTFTMQVTGQDPSNPQQMANATVTGAFDATSSTVGFPGI
jgi:hypothetical protein